MQGKIVLEKIQFVQKNNLHCCQDYCKIYTL